MKDLAMQAYIEYLRDVIKTQNEASTVKDQLIALLEERVAILQEQISLKSALIEGYQQLLAKYDPPDAVAVVTKRFYPP